MSDAGAVFKKAFEQPEWYVTRFSYNIRVRIETIQAFIGNRKPDRILDIGCGDGSLSAHLLTGHNNLVLLDRSTNMLKLARSRIPPELANRVEIKNGDFMDVKLEEGSFDLILCVGVMAYVEDRRAFLRKVVSLLRPGGTLIIECSDGDHFVSGIDRFYNAIRVRFGGAAFPTIRKPAAELLSLLAGLDMEPRGSFRYSLPFAVLRRLLSQKMSYRIVRLIFGAAPRNRSAWLGNECIFHFQRKAAAPVTSTGGSEREELSGRRRMAGRL